MHQKAIDLIKQFEGCKLHAYQDIVGVWTCGFGSTGPEIHSGTYWTMEEAEKRLEEDLCRFERELFKLTELKLSENEMDALLCFCYNVGIGSYKKSTLRSKINSGDIDGASKEFLKWNKAGGKVIEGLTRRRLAEQKLFMSK